jgi:exonuclease SbcC
VDFQNRLKVAAETLKKIREEKEREIGFYLISEITVEQLQEHAVTCEVQWKKLEKQLEEEYFKKEDLQKKQQIIKLYDKKIEELNWTKDSLVNLDSQIQEQEKLLENLEVRKVKCNEMIPELDQLKLRLETIQKGEENFEKRLQVWRQENRMLKQLQERYVKLQSEYEAAVNTYLEKNRLFLSGQAGILAETLYEELKVRGRACCPVCGSVVEKSQAERFAAKEKGVPTQEQVETFREQMEQKQAAATNCARECEVHKNALATAKEEALFAASNLWGKTEDWEQFNYQEKKQELQELQRNLKQKKQTLEKEISETEGSFKKCREILSHLQGQCKTLISRQSIVEEEIKKAEEKDSWLKEIQDISSWKADVENDLRDEIQICKELEKEKESIVYEVKKVRHSLEMIQKLRKELDKTEAAYQKLWKLSSLANGQSGDGGKYSFSRYVLGTFFEEIIDQANYHLNRMTGGKYELIRKQEAERKNESAGLGMVIFDAYTGEQRDTASLSGGESFQVSLSLALGLSDVVRSHSGGVTLDAMFIDEGFGSLDEQALEQAMDVLYELSSDTRQIGIISHVGKLSESISQKIYVKRTSKGSFVQILK